MQPIQAQSLRNASPRGAVIRWMTDAIANGELALGEPLPSERALAERLHVSRKTVRAAFSDMTRRCMIQKPANGRFRHVTSAGANSGEAAARHDLMTNTVVILGADDVSHQPAYTGTVNSIHYTAARLLAQAGHHVLALNPKGADLREGSSLALARPLGVMVAWDTGESTRGQTVLAECQGYGVPVVAFGNGPGLADVDRVDTSHEHGAQALTRHLLGLGRQRIQRVWCLSGDRHWLQQRDAGHEQAMREAGLPVLPSVRMPSLDANSREEFDHNVRLLAGYLSEYVIGPHPVDALMLVTDAHAIHAAAALRLLGKEPNRDLPIVGYDNTCMVCPEGAWERARPVATVDKRNDDIARNLVELLLERINGKLPQEPQCRVVEPEMVAIGLAKVPKKGGA